MAVGVALAVAAVFLATFERWRRTEARPWGIEGWVLAGATALALVGMVATLLATFDRFGAGSMVVGCAVTAVAVFPWGLRSVQRKPRPRRWVDVVAPLVLVGGGLALRCPLGDYALAGRDQGTYTLRAEQTLRSGSFELVDPVLADAGAELRRPVGEQRPGPYDIAGLYPKRRASWRAGLYEAGYRPGWYLADRDRGRVVPQFLHLHPMLMATAGLVVGTERVAWVIPIEATLAMLAVWCVARRLWPNGPWAVIATGLYCAAPLCIWVQRTPLTEVAAGMLLWAAVLALLRARDDAAQELPLAGLLLGALAWLRGNAWITAPIVLAVLWLVPGRARDRTTAAMTYLGVVAAAVLVHVGTVYPYVYDELRRQIGVLGEPTPGRLVVGMLILVIAWISVDALAFGSQGAATDSPQLHWLRRNGVRWVAAALAVACIGYVLTRASAPPHPYSRLDPTLPLLGVPLLLAAAAGVVLVAIAWRPEQPADVWLLAVAAAGVLTVAVYAQRDLPQLGLYYYGRYLVPEVLPAACLAATAALARLHAWMRAKLSVKAAVSISALVTGGIGWSVAGVLVTDPVSRIEEFEGAGRIVDWIAEHTSPDAIVIAGGEGWHHGHTFNQVGGALAVRHDRAVVPYRTREAAFATAWELLVRRPRATGEPAPPIYILINEATHPLRTEAGVRAAVDDVLPVPLAARRIDLLELVVHRLTPVTDRVPTRVTRDDLRMALIRLAVDPADEAAVQRWSFEHYGRDGRAAGPEGLGIATVAASDPRGLCLSPDDAVTLTLPETDDADPRSLVLVAAAGTAVFNHRWSIEIDGEIRDANMPAAHRRARDTLGPLVLERMPKTIVLRGSGKAARHAPCPHGGLLELWVLPADRAWLQRAPVEARTFAPPRDLGHPVRPTAWVSGRGLSRYRPGIEPEPKVEAVSLVLTRSAPLRFAPSPLPADGDAELDVVLTLTRASVGPDARIVLRVDDQVVTRIDPPDMRDHSWQSKPVRIRPPRSVARFELALEAESPDASVHVRDIGLFAIGDAVEARLVPAP